ncbi:hypothetical protein [uncultured Bradyrhizobium sp.]|jgi:hypothetical protein|uniref:hypothetical protein n=1 Tax=uncultured Bradyrhizobium sp. TaxID=199684 RepID=UPI002639D7C7|nr:hypothetical protein [uncultured Bradyrhizobium sp.]
MSLLGFDALGRWALGQLPGSSNFLLVAAKGPVGLAGRASTFSMSQAVATAGALATGIPVSFRIAEAASPAAFICAGNAIAFTPKQLSLGGSFLLTGVPTKATARVLAAQGAALVLGMACQFSASLTSERGAFIWAGGDSTPGRDHEAWVRRPFDTMSWQVEATLPSPAWSGSTDAAGAWTVGAQTANAWTPILIEPEPWTIE